MTHTATHPAAATLPASAIAALAIALVTALLIAVAAYRDYRDRFAIGEAQPRISALDGYSYHVHEGHAAAAVAADRLALLNSRVVALLRHLRTKYVRSGAPESARSRATEKLLTRYNQDNLAENSPKDPSGGTAYTTNKGAVLAICLRSKTGSNEIQDPSILTFATIHEMAHIAIDDTEHPLEFWRTFRFLLEEAENAGIFTSPDYKKYPVDYCGLPVDYSPRWDTRLIPI